MQRAARIAGVSEYVLRAYVRRGELPALKGAKRAYLDPADMRVVREIDLAAPARRTRRRAALRPPAVSGRLAVQAGAQVWIEEALATRPSRDRVRRQAGAAMPQPKGA